MEGTNPLIHVFPSQPTWLMFTGVGLFEECILPLNELVRWHCLFDVGITYNRRSRNLCPLDPHTCSSVRRRSIISVLSAKFTTRLTHLGHMSYTWEWHKDEHSRVKGGTFSGLDTWSGLFWLEHRTSTWLNMHPEHSMIAISTNLPRKTWLSCEIMPHIWTRKHCNHNPLSWSNCPNSCFA